MPGLKTEIQNNLKEGVKKKEKVVSLVLRSLLAFILNKEKEKRYKFTRQNFPEENLDGLSKEKLEELEKESQLTDEEIIDVIFSELKKRKEAILEFEKGKRGDLVEKEKKELEILEKYLPEQLPEEEIKNLVKETVEEIGAKEIKDMGKVMAKLMPKIKGRADGSLASKIVKELLGA